jgi:hypothetical protein
LTAFHIAAQPLAAALESYSASSRRQVIYNGALAIGRRSGGVSGNFTAEVALTILLEGSGLAPRYMAEDAFVLVPAPKRGPASVMAPTGAAARYYGLIQARLLQTLCADDRTAPGNYRLASILWISADGRLAHGVMLDSTGALERDAAIAQMLRGFTVGTSPPIDFAQPVTLVIEPETALAANECQAVRAEVPQGPRR